MNKEIKKICNDKDVVFMDVYDLLADEDGNLKSSYSYDGLHLNENGYIVPGLGDAGDRIFGTK